MTYIAGRLPNEIILKELLTGLRNGGGALAHRTDGMRTVRNKDRGLIVGSVGMQPFPCLVSPTGLCDS